MLYVLHFEEEVKQLARVYMFTNAQFIKISNFLIVQFLEIRLTKLIFIPTFGIAVCCLAHWTRFVLFTHVNLQSKVVLRETTVNNLLLNIVTTSVYFVVDVVLGTESSACDEINIKVKIKLKTFTR